MQFPKQPRAVYQQRVPGQYVFAPRACTKPVPQFAVVSAITDSWSCCCFKLPARVPCDLGLRGFSHTDSFVSYCHHPCVRQHGQTRRPRFPFSEGFECTVLTFNNTNMATYGSMHPAATGGFVPTPPPVFPSDMDGMPGTFSAFLQQQPSSVVAGQSYRAAGPSSAKSAAPNAFQIVGYVGFGLVCIIFILIVVLVGVATVAAKHVTKTISRLGGSAQIASYIRAGVQGVTQGIASAVHRGNNGNGNTSSSSSSSPGPQNVSSPPPQQPSLGQLVPSFMSDLMPYPRHTQQQ